VTAPGFRYEPYQWRGQAEWILRFGKNNGSQAFFIPPLFEELNFTRGLMNDMARGLAAAGIGSWLPDLPGTGESLRDLADLSWDDWREAVHEIGKTIAGQCGSPPHVIALRGGALLADAIEGRSWWTFAPASGGSLLRQLQRTRLIADHDRDKSEVVDPKYNNYAGYILSPDLQAGLIAAEMPVHLSPHRDVPADLHGAKLWRRAEPGRDTELAAILARDIALWIATCERR
jgi:hypothetical protein